jgi:hypothetical protein
MLTRAGKVKKKQRAPAQFRWFAAPEIASPARAAEATLPRKCDLASDDHENTPWFFRETRRFFRTEKSVAPRLQKILKASYCKCAGPRADPISAGWHHLIENGGRRALFGGHPRSLEPQDRRAGPVRPHPPCPGGLHRRAAASETRRGTPPSRESRQPV